MLNSAAVVRVEATRKAWSRCEISNTASLGTFASRANRLVEGATSLAGVILPPETSRSGDQKTIDAVFEQVVLPASQTL